MSEATFESLRDALEDIIKKTKGSRTVTRRLMWIEGRAQSALEGKDWARQVFMMPDPRNSAPKAERLGKEVSTLRYELGEAERKLGDALQLLRRCVNDTELWYAEFGEPSDGSYEAAFVDAEQFLKSASEDPANGEDGKDSK